MKLDFKSFVLGVVCALFIFFAGLLLGFFVGESDKVFEKDINNQNGNLFNDSFFNKDQIYNYSLIKVLNVSCQSHNDCKLPREYAVRSSCHFVSLCVKNKCSVVCPN